MNASSKLTSLLQPQPATYRIRQVTAVNSNGTVDLAWGSDEDGIPVVMTVRCGSGYQSRTVGDIVRVDVSDTPGWLVLDKI